MFELKLREDEIGRKLAEARQTGELQAAPGYGKPFEPDAGWEQTPAEFRMGFKILKDAGVVPAEVEMFQERGRLRAALLQAGADDQRRELQSRLSALEQKLSLRLEALRASGSL